MLFPGGLLPLRLFEPRYLTMISQCLRQGRGFGVCAIRDGREVGAAATPYEIGTLAEIDDWDRGNDGLLNIVARGVRRFRIESIVIQKDQLSVARVHWLDEPAVLPLPDEFVPLAGHLRALLQGLGAPFDRLIPCFEDTGWVTARLIELLPIALAQRQIWLESADVSARLAPLYRYLSR